MGYENINSDVVLNVNYFFFNEITFEKGSNLHLVIPVRMFMFFASICRSFYKIYQKKLTWKWDY